MSGHAFQLFHSYLKVLTSLSWQFILLTTTVFDQSISQVLLLLDVFMLLLNLVSVLVPVLLVLVVVDLLKVEPSSAETELLILLRRPRRSPPNIAIAVRGTLLDSDFVLDLYGLKNTQ